MKTYRQQVNKVVIWLDIVVALAIVASRIVNFIAYWRLATTVGTMSPGLSFIKQEWRGMSLPLLAVVLLCTAAYLEAKQNRLAVMINALPWILFLLVLVKPALTFRSMDGESQAAFIVMITLSSTFLAIVLLSYAWSRHSSRTL